MEKPDYLHITAAQIFASFVHWEDCFSPYAPDVQRMMESAVESAFALSEKVELEIAHVRKTQQNERIELREARRNRFKTSLPKGPTAS